MSTLFINFKTKALVNYLFVIIIFFSDRLELISGTSVICNKVIAIFLLLLTLTTNLKYGLIGIFSMHRSLQLEIVLAYLLLTIPNLFIYQLEIYDITFFFSLGTILILLNTLTDAKAY